MQRFKIAVCVVCLSIALIPFGALICSCERRHPSPSMHALAQQLDVLCASNSLSYQRLVQDAAHEVRRATLHHEWQEVERGLRVEGFHLLSADDDKNPKHFRYLYKNVSFGGSQVRHVLYLEFDLNKRSPSYTWESDKTPAKVTRAVAGLYAVIKRPFSLAAQEIRYPDSSVLSRAFADPETQEMGRQYPTLETLTLTYTYIYDRWSPCVEQGFQVVFEFRGYDPVERCPITAFSHLTAPSGLDPREDWQGRTLPESFEAKDTVGRFWEH